MLFLGYLIWTLIICYILFSRALPRVLSWILQNVLNIEAKVGRLSFVPFCIKNVHISKGNLTVVIDSIGISSSLINSSYSKLLVIYVSDVRFQKDLNDHPQESSKSLTLAVRSDDAATKLVSFRVPPKVLLLLQVTSIHIYNVNVIVLKVVKECLIQCVVTEIKLEGNTDVNSICLNLAVMNLTCRILHHVKESVADSQRECEALNEWFRECLQLQKNNAKAQACLAEVIFSSNFIVSIDPKNNRIIKNAQISVGPDLDVRLSEEFLKIIIEPQLSNENLKFNSDDSTLDLPVGSDTHIFELLPESFDVTVNDIRIRLQLESHLKTMLTVTLHKIQFISSMTPPKDLEQMLPSMESSLLLEDFSVFSDCNKIIALNNSELKVKAVDNKTDASIRFATFFSFYSHESIMSWIDTIVSEKNDVMQHFAMKPPQHKQTTNWSPYLWQFLRAQLSVRVELFDVTLNGNFTPDCVIGSGFKHLVMSFDDKQFFVINYETPLDYSFDGLLESMWCHVGDQRFPDNPNKKLHYWNTPVFVGGFLIKARQNPGGHKLESMFDCANFEWCPELETSLLNCCRCVFELIDLLKQIKMRSKLEASSSLYNVSDESRSRKSQLFLTNSVSQLNVSLTNINVFLRSSKNDKGCFEMKQDHCCSSFDDLKIGTITPSGTCHPCVKAAELKNYFSHVPSASAEFKPHSSEIGVRFKHTVALGWTTTDHMTAHTVILDILNFKDKLIPMLPLLKSKKRSLAGTNAKTPRMSLSIEGTFDVKLCLSHQYRLNILVRHLNMQYASSLLELRMSEVVFKVDQQNLVSLHYVHVTSCTGAPELRAQRESANSLQLQENSAIKIAISSAKMCFPYKYNFADMFSNKAITIVKWLKQLYKKNKVPTSEKSTSLPPDLWIKIKEVTLEICDDPFEVRLHDNHELLEDEYHESLKRWKMLDAKVAELRKTHLHLPAGKVDSLYAALSKKNADIYIKRSQRMYDSTSMRTNLAVFRSSDLELFVMADPSLNGSENVVSHIKNLDPESPWPDELSFSTLWCRMISCNFGSYSWYLRDYPAPLLNLHDFHVWGMIAGAEQVPNKRATYLSVVELGEPWSDVMIERSLPPLKFYYDISCDVENLTMGYGPCWEPAMAEYNLATDLISKPSIDPSAPLPFWDKMRLIYHGRLTMTAQQFTMVLHASLDPYNTTEEVDYTWTDMTFDWTNAKFILKGNLDVYVRTASKYDDCRLFHFPNLKFVTKLDWQCLGDPNDHHSIMPCAPDKLPEYSSNQKHDSYRAFRSLNLNMAVVMETRPANQSDSGGNIPSMLFYSNTLKWLDNLMVILSGVTRPIRRGSVFKNGKPRKISLSRHYKSLRFSLSLHQFEVCYWMSFAKLQGFRLDAKKLTLSSEYSLALVPVDDRLKHRALAIWSAVYMNCELNDGEMWLQSTASDDPGNDMDVSFRAPVEKSYFLSLSRLSYGREACSKANPHDGAQDLFTHQLVVHDLKGSWTKNNRTIAFGLFDSYVKNKVMRHNLSTEALKGFRLDGSSSSPLKTRGTSQNVAGSTSPIPNPLNPSSSSSPLGHAINMLQKLVSEVDKNAVVFSEEMSGNTREQVLHGVAACQSGSVLYRNWLIELINSQVLLKGCETPGYIIISASRAQILQTIHQPVWKEHTLVSKTTWVGSLECMQYYATVDPSEPNPSGDNVQWLTLGNIEEKDRVVISDLADLVGSGQGVGGVVSNTVGAGNSGNNGVQLQRIVSRCGCQFYYVSYGGCVDPASLDEVPPLPPEDSDIWKRESAVDSFTLTHHDLNCSTNSLQYAMLLDIVNNLLLYVEPGKKEALEKLQRLRFQLQLSSVEDQRRPILLLQNNLRVLISNLRRLEKEIYLLQKALDDGPFDEKLNQQMEVLEMQVYETKVQINAQADELTMIISCYKETQLSANKKLSTSKDQYVPWRRRSEVCFKHAQWRLTETDGLLGIADISLSNFLYSKSMKIDDSAEHLLELGHIKVTNCIPNQIYKEVLQPTELQGNIPIDRRCALRVFCREKAAVGGISIKEHFEVNVVPMTLRLTHEFFKTMMKFCFPERDSEISDSHSVDDTDCESVSISVPPPSMRAGRRRIQNRRSASTDNQDDIDKMKERAEKNKMFLFIKIPEVPIRVSYKGEKDKSIKDVQDFNFVLPTLEYHNVTWTWLDLLLAMKVDSRKALLSQAIKHKLQIKSTKVTVEGDEGATPHEDEKVRLLMGNMKAGGAEKKSKTLYGRTGK